MKMRRLLLFAVLALAGCAEAEPGRPAADTPRVAEPTPAAAPEPAPAVPPAPAAAPAPADAFDALGTEPFWAVSIRADAISFSGLDRSPLSWPNPGVRWQGKQRTWTADNVAGRIKVTVAPARCSDGMSDRVYAYSAEVVVRGEVLKGCASKAPA